MTDRNFLNNLRIPTKENPLRILMSACLTGITCGYDGSANGEYPAAFFPPKSPLPSFVCKAGTPAFCGVGMSPFKLYSPA